MFARQVEAFGRPGDVAWGISTSGNSPNVVNALRRARELGLTTIGMTGSGGGRVAEHCDVLMAVPLTETPRVQEVRLVTPAQLSVTFALIETGVIRSFGYPSTSGVALTE